MKTDGTLPETPGRVPFVTPRLLPYVRPAPLQFAFMNFDQLHNIGHIPKAV